MGWYFLYKWILLTIESIIRRTPVNTILCVIDGSHLLLSFVYSIDDYLTSYQHSNFNFPGRDMSAGVECMMDLWNCLIWKLISFQLILILSGGNTSSIQAVTLSLAERTATDSVCSHPVLAKFRLVQFACHKWLKCQNRRKGEEKRKKEIVNWKRGRNKK